jgi:hypothetical protein
MDEFCTSIPFTTDSAIDMTIGSPTTNMCKANESLNVVKQSSAHFPSSPKIAERVVGPKDVVCYLQASFLITNF